jgi:HD-GYP domain-containing protein (c-di-GMP phosphodiesterase class II)
LTLELATGAFLHDIGMTVIPDEIVNKDGPLTPQEWVIMRRHPHEGRAIANRTRAFSPLVLDIIEHHQERYDGSGYPDGLRSDEIPEGARIVAIADAFDALTVQKPYWTAYSLFKALTVVRDDMATGFDRLLLRDFIFSLGQILGAPGD